MITRSMASMEGAHNMARGYVEKFTDEQIEDYINKVDQYKTKPFLERLYLTVTFRFTGDLYYGIAKKVLQERKELKP